MKNLSSFCKICYLGIVLFGINLSYAQGTATKRLQAGMTGNFGLNFQKMGSKKMDVNGVGSDLSVGVLIHTSFKNSNNIGLAAAVAHGWRMTRACRFGVRFRCPPRRFRCPWFFIALEAFPTRIRPKSGPEA